MDQTWICRLYEYCREHPFQKKILLVDRFSQGEQLLNWTCSTYGPFMQMELETIHSWTIKETKSTVAAAGVTLLSNEQSFWIIHKLITNLAAEHSTYLPVEQLTPGMIRGFHKAIQDLRHAEKKASSLNKDVFETVMKGEFIIELLKRYEEELQNRKFTDFPGLLTYLPDQAAENTNTQVIAHQLDFLTIVEREMLRRLNGGNKLLTFKDPSSFPLSLSSSSIESVQFFHAIGVMAEIREALRRVHVYHIPFDQVEVILSDYGSYSIPVYTIAKSLNIPCTYAQGLPALFTNAGKAALAYLEWLEKDFDIQCLLSILRHNFVLLHKRDDSSEVTTQKIIRFLERSGVGWGRERYETLLAGGVSHNQGGENEPVFKHVSETFKPMLSFLPKDTLWSPLHIMQGLVHFIETYALPTNEADVHVLTELRKQVEQMGMIVPDATTNKEAVRYVRDRVEQVRVFSEDPLDGHLFVSSLQDGGESGRKHTFILGMNEASWSLWNRQDPVLLDQERIQIGDLTTSVQQVELRSQERQRRLGRIQGNVTLSCCSYDPVEQEEMAIAFEMLQVVRQVYKDPAMDYSALTRFLGIPVGYMPLANTEFANHLDAADRWLYRFHDQGRVQNGIVALHSAYPFVEQGDQAIFWRSGTALSSYDGGLERGVFAIRYQGETGTPISVTQLEHYAYCPAKYFFESVLKVRLKLENKYDRGSWLSYDKRGSLLHQIFYLYLTEQLQEAGDKDIQHDYERLHTIAEQVILEYKNLIPPPSAHVFEQECEGIRSDVNVFYNVERSKANRPKYLELDLVENGSPMLVEFDNGPSLWLKGIVDRVDEIRPHEYKIYDYKTGNPQKYDENAYFAQGTQLQHILYAVAVEQWLRRSGIDPDARVVESAYYFPTERGRGEEVLRIPKKRAELSLLLTSLINSMESGVFPPTSEPKRCSSCDYLSVCGGSAGLAKGKWQDEANDEALMHLKEVQSYG